MPSSRARSRYSSLAASPGAAGPLLAVMPGDFVLPPDPDAEDIGWQERALCAQTDPEQFWPEKGGSTTAAKRVCMACEVRPDCLAYALEHNEREGIWGGLAPRERRRLGRHAA